MIIYKKGNLLREVSEGMIVHGCNAQGVMGSGFAKQVKDLYPDVFLDYVNHLKFYKKEKALGTVQYSSPSLHTRLVIANAITQKYYGNDGNRYINYGALETCLEDVSEELGYMFPGVELHMPKIGCGLGGGDWDTVADIIEYVFGARAVYVWELK